MKYRELDTVGNKYRETYIDTLNQMIEKMQNNANLERDIYFKDFFSNPEKYREELKEMLGWPLTNYTHNIPNAKIELISKETFINIYRITLELPIGIQFYGLFFEHSDKTKAPLVIAQHGGLGTPESCSGMLEGGSSNYNDMVLRVYNKGANVFAPQLLLWDKQRFVVDYDRTDIDGKLKQLGSSISAVEIYGIIKSIDYLCSLDCIDENRIGMVGLSYGGFYSLFTAAIDKRIKAAIACSQFNNRYKYSWPDWTWFKAAKKFMDKEVACLVYPRKLYVFVGDEDELFDSKLAYEEYKKLTFIIKDENWLDFHIFKGCHEFFKDDLYIDNFFSYLNN